MPSTPPLPEEPFELSSNLERGSVELVGESTATAPAAAESPLSSVETVSVASASTNTIDWGLVGVVAYGLVIALLFARLMLGQVALGRVWRNARPAPDWTERLFGQLAAPICPQVRLRVFDRAGGPVCFGVWQPRVLIPADLVNNGDGPALRSVLIHELGHLGRRDPLVGWLLGLTRAIYFVWPWLVSLRREIRVAQEHLADADAARAIGPAEYAELLIRMTRARTAPLGAAGVRGPTSDLYRRVTMLLQTKGHVEGRCPRRCRALARRRWADGSRHCGRRAVRPAPACCCGRA